MTIFSLKRMTAVLVAVFSGGSLLLQRDSINNKPGTAMQTVAFTPTGDLIITPSASSSKTDFDFLIGPHRIHHKKLITRLNNCTQWDEFEGSHEMQTLLNGMGNLENHCMK